MRTPPVQVEAIRALQRAVSEDVTRYFATEPDGSFEIDVGVFRAGKARHKNLGLGHPFAAAGAAV
jgi:hypothetical protein